MHIRQRRCMPAFSFPFAPNRPSKCVRHLYLTSSQTSQTTDIRCTSGLHHKPTLSPLGVPNPSQNPSSRYFSTEPPQSANDAATKSLEDTYSRKTPLEHILLRPSMYVGPTERLPPVSSWVLQSDVDSSVETPSPWTMQRQEISFVPALIKIFDEILVNASDNRLRHPSSCNRIDVILHRGGGKKGLSKNLQDQIPDLSKPYISIRNNGKSIPVQIHNKEKIYIP